MKITAIYSFAIIVLLSVSCSSESNDKLPEEISNNPQAVLLVFPDNNTECNEGTIISDQQSRVEFQWQTAAHTDSYELVLTNKETEEISTFETIANAQLITIDRGVSFSWYVVSKSDISEQTAKSETFQFYNAAASEVHHVPFSAEAISPENGSDVTPSSTQITLQWEASDIDNDIKEYEVYFGADNKNLELISVQENTTLNVDITTGNTYYWSIKTIDESNNTAVSETFSFSV